jgi:transposase
LGAAAKCKIASPDGTNKYNEIVRKGATAAACMAHVHCRFEDAWNSDPEPAEFPMGLIKSLFDIERVAAPLSEDERHDLRQRIARPKMLMFKDWLDEMKARQLPKGNLEDKVSYTLNRWPALLTYLDHPNVEISNNGSERSIKPMVISREIGFFAALKKAARPPRQS